MDACCQNDSAFFFPLLFNTECGLIIMCGFRNHWSYASVFVKPIRRARGIKIMQLLVPCKHVLPC